MGLDLDNTYENNMAYNQAFAETPSINLSSATLPILSYHDWIYTEGNGYDGYNMNVSTHCGPTFSGVTTVTPPYNATVDAQPAWNGNQSGEGWQPVLADLAAYAGQTIILRWSFRSDFSVVYPGVYVDDVVVAEADSIPLSITTTSIPDA